MTWQGIEPRPRSSAPSTWDGSPEPSGSPAVGDEPDTGDEEALRDAGDLADEAEAEVDPEPGADPAVDRERLRAEQRLADQLVVDAVLEEGLDGPWHRTLDEALIRYAVPVLCHLLSNGKIVSKATRLRRPPAAPDAWLDFTMDDRQEFAHEMVANALPGFTRAVFEDRRWTPDRGASLKTYFVNACILEFARLQGQWLSARKAVRPSGLEVDPDAVGPAPDPATTVAAQDEVRRVLSKITDHRLREVVVLRGAGWTAEAAALEAGLTVKAAEGRLARFRRDLKDERASTEPRANGRPGSTTQGGR